MFTPRRDDDASPLSSYRFMLRPTWMISALWQKSKYKSKFNFDLFWKKLTFGFSCCSTRKDLSIDVSITNVGLISTKPGRFHLGYVQNLISSISNFFWKKKSTFMVSVLYYSWRPFHWCINYYCRTDIDEARVNSFLGVRTDRQTGGQTDIQIDTVL